MKPNNRFVNLGKDFWASIRTISEQVGYTCKAAKFDVQSGQIKVPVYDEVRHALQLRGLDSSYFGDETGKLTKFGEQILDYYVYRADVLNNTVAALLMDVERAKNVFDDLYQKFRPSCPIPMNKQKGVKKAPAYFTGIINMLIDANAGGLPCDYDPRQLTTVVRNNHPLRTLARRVDGAFPSVINPVAIWEIKEYYYTTTFGSRVADGVYETLLDGMELEELEVNEGIKVKHYLMIDSHYTWWVSGKSYLCRIIDMLHMGYVDEVLFGYEVVDCLPELVRGWVEALNVHSFG